MLRPFGFILTTVGVIYLLIAFNLDVGVEVPTTYLPFGGRIGGGEVANIDLMARRQNHIIVACLLTLIGALMAIFGNRGEPDMPQSLASGQSGLSSPYDGERILTEDRYRLWLAERYGIARNEVFGRFVVDDQTFPDLDAALSHCHDQESREKIENSADVGQEGIKFSTMIFRGVGVILFGIMVIFIVNALMA